MSKITTHNNFSPSKMGALEKYLNRDYVINEEIKKELDPGKNVSITGNSLEFFKKDNVINVESLSITKLESDNEEYSSLIKFPLLSSLTAKEKQIAELYDLW